MSSSVARVTEITARSPKSFEDALQVGLSRATKTLRGVTSAWIKAEGRDQERQDRFVSGEHARHLRH